MKFLNYKTGGFLLYCILIFSSCSTAMLYTSLDVLRPAQVEFAPGIDNLLIVNNTTVQPANVGHTTRLLNSNPENVPVQTDSAALFCLSVLTQEIEDKNFFISVDLELSSINENNDFNSIVPLQQKTVRNLCEEYNVDAILSLDHMVIKDDVTEYYNYDNGGYLSALDVHVESLWSIHYLERTSVTTVHFKDSLSWESESYNRPKALEELPDRLDAIIDAVLYAGQNSAKRFIPYWEKVDRYFFNPTNSLMTQGMDSVYIKNWNGAISCWQKMLNSSNNYKLTAQAANNIAIAYEILEDYDKALYYAELSLDLFSSKIIVDYEVLARIFNYVNELHERKKEIQMLNEQLRE